MDAKPIGVSSLQVCRESNQKVEWRGYPNIFNKTAQMGIRSALIRWYHPYVQMITQGVSYCDWVPFSEENITFTKQGIRGIMFNQLISLFPLAGRYYHMVRYQTLTCNLSRILSLQYYNFVFTHLPVPHFPPIYNENKREATFMNFECTVTSYFSNLRFTDQTFGDILRLLEHLGIWDQTTVIVSSNHHWRELEKYDGKSDYRVPFIIKLNNQKKGIVYNKPFNTVLTKDMVLAIFRKEITTPESLVQWLDKHRTIGVSPVLGRKIKEGLEWRMNENPDPPTMLRRTE